MMKFLRSQSQTVLVVVLGVIGLGFLFYGNAGNLLTAAGPHASNDFGRIDGDDLSIAELSDAVRNEKNGLIMHGQVEALRQPKQIAALAWQRLLIEREAGRLHISISDKEVVDFIRSLPLFQKNGTYSPEAYDTYVQHLKDQLRLPPDSGIDPVANAKNVMETVFRMSLLTDAVTKALFNGVRSSAHDVSDQYQKYYGPITASVVTINPTTLVAPPQVTPAQIEAEYKAHPENPDFRTKEERRVDYVLFLLSPEQQKLPEDKKAAAKAVLGQKATDFALAFQPDPSADNAAQPIPAFMDEAKKLGVPVQTTGFFTDDSTPAGVPPSPAFNSAAFALTKDNAISKVVELENGVAVLHLVEIKPSDLLPLAQATPIIAKQLQASEAASAGQVAAHDLATKLKAEVAKGIDFKAAAAALKLKVETLPPIVPMNSREADPRTQSVVGGTFSLAPGQVSDLLPGPDNTFLVVHLDSRGPADAAGLAQFETRFRDMQDSELRQQAINDWAEWKSKQPGTHKPPQLDAFGAVE